MENNINCISIDDSHLPIVEDCDLITASDNFYHINRTADFNVLIYVTEGVMYVTEDELDYEIHPGELLILKSGAKHYGKYETPRGTRWIYAHFRLNNGISEKSVIVPKKTCLVSGGETEEKLYNLSRTFHSSKSLSGFKSNILLYEILLETCSDTRTTPPSLSDKICSFLDLQINRDFSKELISNRFYLSYSHLAAVFRNEKGISMGQYHNEMRMKKACNLLRSTLLSVGEIADELGFSDMLYFSKKFHAFSGVSPTEYRKQAQQKY